MTDSTTTLTVEQQQRAEALDKARAALTAKGFASSGAADPIDLVNLASWIVDGNDLWVDIIADAAEKAAEPICGTCGHVHLDKCDCGCNHGWLRGEWIRWT